MNVERKENGKEEMTELDKQERGGNDRINLELNEAKNGEDNEDEDG